MRRTRQISLAAYTKIPLEFPQSSDSKDVGGIANSKCLLSTDIDGDGNVELVVGLLGGKLAIFKSLEQTTAWATSASILGSIVAVSTGFVTRPRPPTTLDTPATAATTPAITTTVSANNHPQIIVISAEGACHIFELFEHKCGHGCLVPTACYPVAPSVQCAAVVRLRDDYDDLCIATTEKTLHVYSATAKTSIDSFQWRETSTWNINGGGGCGGAVASVSTMPQHPTDLVVGLQSGKMIIFDLTIKSDGTAASADAVRGSYSTSMPKRRAMKVAERQRRQRLKYRQFFNNIGKGDRDKNHAQNNINHHAEETPMSLMMQMQQSHAEQRMREQMHMEASGATKLASSSSASTLASSSSSFSSLSSSIDGNFDGNGTSVMDGNGRTSGGTASIGEWTAVYGHLHGWHDFPNACVPWVESAKEQQNNNANAGGGKDENQNDDSREKKHTNTDTTIDTGSGSGSLVVAATLEGDMSIWNIATGQLCWYDAVGLDSGQGQIFAIDSIDITGDGVEELIACAWDGTTFLFDRRCECAMFAFGDNVLGFLACELTVTSSHTHCERSNQGDVVGGYVGTQPCLVYGTNDAVTVYVMGSTTQEQTSKENVQDVQQDPMAIKSSRSLELIGSVSDASRSAVVHDPGRPVCYVRTPSLDEALRHRGRNLPEKALELAKICNNDGNTQGKKNDKLLLQKFYQSCLLQNVGNHGEDPMSILTTCRDTMRKDKTGQTTF